jgi:hypothetical protein
MESQLYRICPVRRFDYSGLAASATVSTIVAERVPVGAWTEYELVVRVHHANTSIASGGALNVDLLADFFSPQDPSQPMIQTSAVATLTVGPNDAAGTCYSQVFSATTSTPHKQQFVAVQIRPVQGSGAGANLKAYLSIDIICRR